MHLSAYDFRDFYNTRQGRVVRRVLARRMRDLWPDIHDFRLMGVGYVTPYLRGFLEEAERTFSMMPAEQGAHVWPLGEAQNLVCLMEDGVLPLETNSVDRIIMVHSLEFSETVQQSLQEIWRVLKSNGRVLLVVPNRGGFWARADKTPFGQGTPYSGVQIKRLLRRHLFVHEQTQSALYLPPIFSFIRSLQWFERFGQNVLPFGGGVHIVEATKQLYARSGPSSGAKVTARSYGLRPAAEGMSRKRID